jgi:hypothetical protein
MNAEHDKPPLWFWIVFLGAWLTVIIGPVGLAMSGALPEVGQEVGRVEGVQ